MPWDRDCTSATSCPGHFAPTFWTTKRLSTVTTQVATGPQQYKDVESWTLGVQWLDPAAGDQSRIMWLNTITRTALNGTDPDIAMPPIVFGPTGSIMANRVNSADTNGAFRRYRLGTIANESGAVLGITYSPPDCAVGSKMPANPETNTYRCFPVLWTPPGGSQILDYFHKYVVTSVTTADNAGGNPTMSTAYAYPNDGAFWHYDTSELTPPAQKTWGQWRGYEQVTVTTGSVVPGAPQLQTVTKFFRGAHGDKLPSGTRSKTYTVSGTSYNDEDWFAGRSYQEIVFNGPGGAVVTDTLTEPWTSPVTASRTIDGITTEARAVRTLRTTTRTKLDGGRPDRVAVVTKTYTDGTDGTPPGRVRTVDDQGDVAVASDDQCTRITYARNDPANMHELVAEMETDGLRCSATPTTATDVLALTRTWYDGGSVFPTTPTKGDASKAQVLTVWSTTPANRVFLTTGRSSYDPYGRVLDTFDVLDRKTSTAYTPPSGGPLTATAITNPKLWITTTTYEPAWGQPTKVTDPNGRVTELAYDAAGRVTAVWMPGWSKAAHPNLASRSIAYTIRASGGPSVIAHQRAQHRGHRLPHVLPVLRRIAATAPDTVQGGDRQRPGHHRHVVRLARPGGEVERSLLHDGRAGHDPGRHLRSGCAATNPRQLRRRRPDDDEPAHVAGCREVAGQQRVRRRPDRPHPAHRGDGELDSHRRPREHDPTASVSWPDADRCLRRHWVRL